MSVGLARIAVYMEPGLAERLRQLRAKRIMGGEAYSQSAKVREWIEAGLTREESSLRKTEAPNVGAFEAS